ncbi:MAG TPA: 50S ribosomal protein L30 [Longimicrobiales bacterium]
MPRKARAAAPSRLEITQIRSGIGRPAQHRRTLRALGLRRHQQTVVQPDNPAIRGMIFQVRHLVSVRELAEGEE